MRDIIINILAALILLLTGYLLTKLKQAILHFRFTRRWGLSSRRPVVIYVGVAESAQEPTGYVGGGEAYALQELGSHLASLGCPYEVRHAGNLLAEEIDDDLIILGGPDTNILTRRTLERLKAGLGIAYDPTLFSSNPIQIYDNVRQELLSPDVSPGFPTGGRGSPLSPMTARSDFGVVISAPSPFKRERRVISIFGAFGYGTWGAIRWLKDARLPRPIRLSSTGFECVIPVDVIGSQPAPHSDPVVQRPIRSIHA